MHVGHVVNVVPAIPEIPVEHMLIGVVVDTGGLKWTCGIFWANILPVYHVRAVPLVLIIPMGFRGPVVIVGPIAPI